MSRASYIPKAFIDEVIVKDATVNSIMNLVGSTRTVANIVAKVDTIADLLQIDTSKLETGEQFYVLGYHTKNDGGGGIFYWDADEDKANHNGGTIIDPTQTFPNDWNDTTQQETWFTASGTGNGCWKRVVGVCVTPEMFGAKGDGVTDDTKAVQRADYFRKVFFTNVYVITDTIVKNMYSSWYGFGFPQNRDTNTNPTIISKVDGTLIDLTQSFVTRLESEIKGIEFFSDLDSYPNAICILAENCRSLKLENLKVRQFRQGGIRYIGGGILFAKDVYISNCGYAWHLKNTADCWLYNCHGGTGNTKVSSYDFPDPGYGFFIENCNNINFVSARGEVSTVSGWHIVDSERLTLMGCYADNNWKNGIEIINCSDIDIISPKVFSNGNSDESVNNGISVSSNDGTCSNIRIIGGFSSNEDGTQDRGINFFNLNSGTVQDIYLVGLDLSNNPTPLNGESNVTRLSVIECAGYKNISRRRKVGRVQVPIDTAGVQEVTVDCSDLEGELTVEKIITGLGAPTHSDFDGYTFPGPVDNNNKTATLKINVVTPSATTGAYTWIHYIIETI